MCLIQHMVFQLIFRQLSIAGVLLSSPEEINGCSIDQVLQINPINKAAGVNRIKLQ